MRLVRETADSVVVNLVGTQTEDTTEGLPDVTEDATAHVGTEVGSRT